MNKPFCFPFATVLLAFLPFASISAQNSPVLEEYIRTGLANNLALRQRNFEVQKQSEAIRQARALSYPTLSFNASYTMAAGGRRIDFPVGDLLNPVYANLNAINDVFAPDVPDFPTLENQQIQFLPNNFQETKIKFAYPLFNSDIRYNRQIQEQLLESNSAQQEAAAHELRYQITTAYLQYLQALEAEKIWQGTRATLSELRRFNESLVKNNVATRDVVAAADYELSKADREIFQLRAAQNTARAYFNLLINRDLQSEVNADSALLRAPVAEYRPEELLRQALSGRREFAALHAGLAASATEVRRNEANLRLPDLYIGGEAGFQGYGYHFGNGQQAYALGQVGLTYALYDAGLRRSKAAEARIAAAQLQTQQEDIQQKISLEVTKAWNDFEAARQSYATAQAGQRAAEEAFRIVNNKYRANQVLLLEMLDAQNRLTAGRLQTVLAWVDVLIKEADLRKAAGL